MQQAIDELPPLDMAFDPLAARTLDGDMNAARWRDDHKLTKRFRRDAVLNPRKSQEARRAVFDEVDFITIWTPGSQLTVIDAPINSGFYMQRFGDDYRKWKENMENAVSGTPLEHFPFLFQKVGLIKELQASNILTVEQLAGLPDSAVQKFMGGYELRKMAIEWLTKSGADAVDAEKEAMKKRLADLEEQLKALTVMGLAKPDTKAAGKPVTKE